ncbi:MAG: GMC family oxidoreductase, partial [Alphaproteobacteria bacterium]|nr:GMC family oxidoreductase [Alphaproteobacteria bacterium]
LLDTPLRVAVVETGGFVRSPSTEALNELVNDGPLPLDTVTTRPRVLGGGSIAWGSFCTPLDSGDFAGPPEQPMHRWPFGPDELAPYYRRAQRIFELGPPEFDERLWPIFGAVPPRFDARLIRTKFWQFRSPSLLPLVAPLRFGAAFRGELAAAQRCQVILNATVTGIRPANEHRHVDAIDIRSLSGRRAQIRARCFVLAAGTIENARLLLLSAIGNEHDMVGRCFMEHPHVAVATLSSADPAALLDTWAIRRRRQSVALQPSMCPADALRASADILNCCLAVEIDRDPNCPTHAFAMIAEALRHRRRLPEPWRNLWRIVSDPGTFARNAYRRLVKRSGVLPRVRSISLYSRSEQEPNPDSRVTLHRERDALGMNRARLEWRLSERDRRTVSVFAHTVASEFVRLGIAEAAIAPWLRESAGWPEDLRGGPHHSGTTRMSDDPHTGVVDRDGRIHSMRNLYVAGASVFPTGGYVNPGLTVVAMAIRMADHLRSQLPTLTR